MDFLDDWNTPEGVGAVEFGATAAAPGQDLFDVEVVKDYISRGRGTPVAVALTGETLVVATSRNWLIRVNLMEGGPEALSELDLQRNPESTRCQRLWMDPTATHTIAMLGTTDPLAPGADARSWSGELVYVASTWKKAKNLSKLKNKPVCAVAFLEGVSDSTSIANNVLVGTAVGELVALDVRDPSREHVKVLINLTPDQPILSLRVLHGPAGSSNFPPLFVLVLTRSHLHAYWGGKGSLVECISDIAPSGSLDLTQTVKQTARIVLTKPLTVGEPSPDPRTQINQVAILCETGILRVPVHLPDLRSNDTQASSVFSTPHFLPLEACNPALALASTSFHYVLLSPAALTLVNRVSNEVAQVVPFARLASSLTADTGMREALNLLSTSEDGSPAHTRVFLWARDALLELDTSREDRDIWRAFLDVGDYSAAALHCRNAEQRSAVYLAHGEACIRTGAWLAAGELFGKVTVREPSFEDLALRFMDAAQPAALQQFLEARLDILSSRKDQLQRTLVASWLLELMLDRRNQAALAVVDTDDSDVEGEEQENTGNSIPPQATEEGADLSGITAKLRTFLQTQTEVLDAGTTTELLVGYGQTELLEVYAFARGDFETVLELLVQRNDAKRALEVLRHPEVGPELVYKFAPALAAQDSEQSVEAWLHSSDPLDPSRLLPALLTLASAGGAAGRAAAKRYLSAVLDDASALRLGLTQPVTDRALYDLMLDLLCTRHGHSTINGPSSDEEETDKRTDDADGKSESALLQFLESARSPLGTPRYDPKLALRLARERGCHRASVQLYEDLGLPSEAVKAALEFDQGLAIQVAQRAGGDRGQKRRVWLDIAGHLIRRSEDPKDQAQGIALVKSLLENSKGVLHIEDVLPLFPEFTEIDAFKDVLCTALEAYNEEIEDLKREMSISTKTAHAIRGYLAGLETRVGVLGVDARCARCDRPLGAPPPVSAGPSGGAVPKLYLFPTGNAFHGACLAAEVSAVAPRIQRQRIATALTALASGRDVARHLADLEADVAQADPFWSESCLVQLVQKPYIPPNELEAELQSWAL